MSASDIDVIKNAPDKAAKIVSEFRKAVSLTKGKQLLSEKQKADHVRSLQEKAKDRIAELESDVTAARKRLTTGDGKKVQGSVAEAQLSETIKSKAWSRLKTTLDASRKPGSEVDTLASIQDEIAKAVGEKDTDVLTMIQEEVGPYLVANGLDMYADIMPVLMKSAQPLLGATASPAVMSDVEPRAKRVLQGITMATHVIDHIDETMQGHIAISEEYSIPAFTNGEIVTIERVRTKTQMKDSAGQPVENTELPELSEVT